jgi:hypothetical protein
MASHSHQVLTSSERFDWRTPKPLFDALHREFDFTLDGAADETNHLLPRWLGPGSAINEDALDAALTPAVLANERIFVNWPYSVKHARLRRKAGDELGARALEIENWMAWAWSISLVGGLVVAVTPASVQTEYWRQHVWQGLPMDAGGYYWHRATEARILPHRVKFDPPTDLAAEDVIGESSNVNTAVVIWRPFDSCFTEPWAPQLRYWTYR